MTEAKAATEKLDEAYGRAMDMLEYQCLPLRWTLQRATESDPTVARFERDWRLIERRIQKLAHGLLATYNARDAKEQRATAGDGLG